MSPQHPTGLKYGAVLLLLIKKTQQFLSQSSNYVGEVEKKHFIYWLSCISLIAGLRSQIMTRQCLHWLSPPSLTLRNRTRPGNRNQSLMFKCTLVQISCDYLLPVRTGDPRTLKSSHHLDCSRLQHTPRASSLFPDP